MPEWFLECPDGDLIDEELLGDFWSLSTCRQIGMCEGPIPWTAIVSYADREGLDAVACQLFVRVIQTMDTTYLKWQEEQRNRKKK